MGEMKEGVGWSAEIFGIIRCEGNIYFLDSIDE